MENRLCLLDCNYEKERARVVLYFGKDPLDKSYEFVYKCSFFPYFTVGLKNELVSELLFDFKKDISIKSIEDKTKVLARDFETLAKTAKLLQQTTGKNIILIEPERQFLVRNNWSYYDSFLVSKDILNKVNSEDFIHSAISNYTKRIDEEERIKLVVPLTRKLLLSNLLKVKPESNIKNDQILNTLFENEFFYAELTLRNANNFYYQTKKQYIKEHINLDFSNVLPYLLTNRFGNIGYDTLNCPCCKPKDIFDENVLPSSLVKVEFNKSGFYFVSCDESWALEYHNSKEKKENRECYKKQNGLLSYPIGPFTKGETEYILLTDAVRMSNTNECKILDCKDWLSWTCKRQESFVSRLINELIRKQQGIEGSINISSTLGYGSGDFKSSRALEENPLYIQYLTEYSLLNSLIEEIPRFLQHKNTKFYSLEIDNAIRSITYDTISKINKGNEVLLLNKNSMQLRNKKLLVKINQAFPRMNLPIPRLVTC